MLMTYKGIKCLFTEILGKFIIIQGQNQRDFMRDIIIPIDNKDTDSELYECYFIYACAQRC